MEIGWRVVVALVAGISATVITRPADYERLRFFSLHWWGPYVGLVLIGTVIGYWTGIL